MGALRRLWPGMVVFCSSLLFSETLPQVKLLEPPTYPRGAYQARVAGTVKLEVEVDVSGNVEKTRIVSGHPLLAAAARENVRNWQFGCEQQQCLRQVSIDFVYRLDPKLDAASSPVVTLQLPSKVTIAAATPEAVP